VQTNMTASVAALQKLPPAIRNRVLSQHLLEAGVKEPEAAHIALLEKLIFSDNPSARAEFPGGVTFTRCYDTLQVAADEKVLAEIPLACPGVTELPGLRIICSPNEHTTYNANSFPVCMGSNPVVRARRSGDSIRLSGGTKTLKKLLIDQKIPAARREQIPVLADDTGVVMVAGIGGNLDRLSLGKDAIRIEIQYL
jgi:tRNA(Ile)-lysidine synthase